ncbi:type II toxin-antitoxin system PemK/MazF family toxin [Antarcticibacterium flavum]|uniref:mRNA interferase n=1 Tax=Antarcticibacterium flavum TaxID=2058175 RepID=A0A5B7X7E6_9FLAO|nr:MULTISPECIES: type II toxin-antitoxin system PemK/MazF family toxin [Antarcticibacterium]MCM4159701.1 transcription elongation factor GreAB [Antarcticibacterium sp. W02-3]QCY70638.1 type II toxin-antitoxin system PemK/MazF family toxin [Antarcticibacterium flavum]
MKQGEIWDIHLDPVLHPTSDIGARGMQEQGGRRPAVIISGNLVNKYLDVVIVCPLTSKIKNYKGNLILLPDEKNGLQQKSEVLTFHIRSISKKILDKKLGELSSRDIESIKATVDDILRY